MRDVSEGETSGAVCPSSQVGDREIGDRPNWCFYRSADQVLMAARSGRGSTERNKLGDDHTILYDRTAASADGCEGESDEAVPVPSKADGLRRRLVLHQGGLLADQREDSRRDMADNHIDKDMRDEADKEDMTGSRARMWLVDADSAVATAGPELDDEAGGGDLRPGVGGLGHATHARDVHEQERRQQHCCDRWRSHGLAEVGQWPVWALSIAEALSSAHTRFPGVAQRHLRRHLASVSRLALNHSSFPIFALYDLLLPHTSRLSPGTCRPLLHLSPTPPEAADEHHPQNHDAARRTDRRRTRHLHGHRSRHPGPRCRTRLPESLNDDVQEYRSLHPMMRADSWQNGREEVLGERGPLRGEKEALLSTVMSAHNCFSAGRIESSWRKE